MIWGKESSKSQRINSIFTCDEIFHLESWECGDGQDHRSTLPVCDALPQPSVFTVRAPSMCCWYLPSNMHSTTCPLSENPKVLKLKSHMVRQTCCLSPSLSVRWKLMRAYRPSLVVLLRKLYSLSLLALYVGKLQKKFHIWSCRSAEILFRHFHRQSSPSGTGSQYPLHGLLSMIKKAWIYNQPALIEALWMQNCCDQALLHL